MARKQQAGAPASPNASQRVIDGARLLELVTRMAVETDQHERRLRALICELIEGQRISQALALLQAWDSTAAGDVLRQHTRNELVQPTRPD